MKNLKNNRLIIMIFMIFSFSLVQTESVFSVGREETYLKEQSSFGNRFKRFLKDKVTWFNVPLVLAAGAVGYNLVDLAIKKRKNKEKPEQKKKTWKEKAKDFKIGLAGLVAAPVLWGLSSLLYKSKKLVDSYEKDAERVCISWPEYTATGDGQTENINRYLDEEIYLPFRKIEVFRVPRQSEFIDCGYRALYYASRLAKYDIAGVFDENKYESVSLPWKKAVLKYRESKGRSGFTNVSSEELEDVVIKKHVSCLRGQNSEDGMRQVHVKRNVSIIDNIGFVRMLVKDGAVAGLDKHTLNNLANFKRSGERQIIILNTSSDIFSYGQYSSCFHYICVELTKINNGTKIRIFDSLRSNDCDENTLDIKYCDVLNKLFYLIEIINV